MGGGSLCGLWVRHRKQTVDLVVLECPNHRPSHGLHGLIVLADEHGLMVLADEHGLMVLAE